MKMSIKKLSELSGFSPATVSNALNGKRSVSAETAEKITRLAQQYGYTGSAAGERVERTAGDGRIRVVTYRESGKVFSDSPFFSFLLEGVENECHAQGYETAVVNLYRHQADYEERVADLLADRETGILLIGTELTEETARPFADADAPLVLVDAWFDRVPFNAVLMDNEASVQRAVEYLIGQGHERIGYLKSSVSISNFERRSVGWQRALVAHGLAPDERYIFRVPPSIVGACEAMRHALDEGRELPTAFFADNDMIALGAMQTLQARGLRIPEDISIVGFDDITFSEAFTPGLTTVRVAKKELGRIAVRRLLESMRYPSDVHTRTELVNDLVIRGSVAAPKL